MTACLARTGLCASPLDEQHVDDELTCEIGPAANRLPDRAGLTRRIGLGQRLAQCRQIGCGRVHGQRRVPASAFVRPCRRGVDGEIVVPGGPGRLREACRLEGERTIEPGLDQPAIDAGRALGSIERSRDVVGAPVFGPPGEIDDRQIVQQARVIVA